MPDRQFLSVGEAADELGIRPRVLSDLFYARQLSTERCPVIAGRRLVPRNYLPEIALILRGQTDTTAGAAQAAGTIRSDGKTPSQAPMVMQ